MNDRNIFVKFYCRLAYADKVIRVNEKELKRLLLISRDLGSHKSLIRNEWAKSLYDDPARAIDIKVNFNYC